MAEILVLQIKRIGDLALTFPLFGALASAGCRVSALVPAGLVPLVQSVCPDVTPLPWVKGAPLRTARMLRSRPWDAVIDLTRTDRSALFTRCARTSRRIGYAEYARGWKRLVYTERSGAQISRLHTLDYHLAPARESGLIGSGDPSAPSLPPLPLPLRTRLGSAPWIILHPGTTKPEKYWPAAHWRKLIARIAPAGSPLILTGGSDPHEQSVIREILSGSPAGVTDLSGQLSLSEVCALVAHARAVISVDTGIMHFAALWQIPQVALFGPTQPLQWMPRHPRAAVLSSASFRAKGPLKLKKKQRIALHGEDSEWEPLDSVWQRLRDSGSAAFHCGFRPGTMADILPDQVAAALDRVTGSAR